MWIEYEIRSRDDGLVVLLDQVVFGGIVLQRNALYSFKQVPRIRQYFRSATLILRGGNGFNGRASN